MSVASSVDSFEAPPVALQSADGRHTVYVGDCSQVLAALPPESFDVVVTSPPYNLGVRYNSYNDHLAYDEYLAWMRDVFALVERILRPNGSFFLNVGAQSSQPWLAYDVASQARERFVLQNHVIWVKSISIGDDTYGHYKPLHSRRYLNNTFEDLFHFTKSGAVPIDRLAIGVPFKDKSNIGRFNHAEDRHCRGNAWYVPYETVQSRTEKSDHPAIYPVDLVKACLKMHGLRPDLNVLDPFLGTGTTSVASALLGARSVGIEVDPQYARRALERIDTAIRLERLWA